MRWNLVLILGLLIVGAFAASCGGDDSGPVESCGDGYCSAPETCSTCPADCGACCGNGVCSGSESCTTCPADCGSCPGCGDGSCGSGETCSSCPGDCGACPPECTQAACVANSSVCGCIAPTHCVWNSALRVGSCSGCGDGACGSGETCTSCPGDCGSCPGCGDGACNAGAGENCNTCTLDCPCATGQVCMTGGYCLGSTDPCASYYACDTCTPIGGCGWCRTTGACSTGTATGPTTGTCGTWNWNLSDCPTTCPASADCTGRVCGPDPVCATSCGTCSTGEACTLAGICEPTGCTSHAECDSVSLCLYGHCELAWGRNYTITIQDGHIPTAGACWDVGCGAPDPYVQLFVDGTLHATPYVNDTFDPVWGTSFTAVLSSSSTMSAQMWDDDIGTDNLMYEWASLGITIAYLKAGVVRFGDATGAFTLIQVLIAPVL